MAKAKDQKERCLACNRLLQTSANGELCERCFAILHTSLHEVADTESEECRALRSQLEEQYSQRVKERELKVTKTVRQSVAHGSYLLARANMWLLLLIDPDMIKGISFLQPIEIEELLRHIAVLQATMAAVKENLKYGNIVPDEQDVMQGE